MSGAGGTPVWAVLSIVAGSFILVGLAGYGIYRYRLRGEMHQEIRDIMAQYMPLEDSEGGTLDPGTASKLSGRRQGHSPVLSPGDEQA